jgi:peroxiredoxin
MPPVSQSTVTSYAVFLIDTDKRIRSIFKYSNTTGRNFYEILRTYDALIMTSYHRVVTPANWAQGQEVLLNPEITPEEAQNYRFAQIKPYFKLSPCPPP